MRPPITAIIPAYNVGQYIGEAIDSALKQDPPFKEIIVIDDGSTDNIQEIILSYNDPTIRYLYQENKGLGPARNKGIELANTEWIYFMDGDDVLAPGFTAEFARTHKEHPDLDLFAFSALDFEHGTNKVLPSSNYMQRRRSGHFKDGRSALVHALEQKNFPVCAFLYAFRKSVIDRDKRLRFMNIVHEDESFTPELFLRSGITSISSKIFYRRRVRAGSIMTTPASIKNVFGYLTASRWWLDAASARTRHEKRLFDKQALNFYAFAMLYAARAELPYREILTLVKRNTPEFSRHASRDAALMYLSRRLGFRLIQLRRTH